MSSENNKIDMAPIKRYLMQKSAATYQPVSGTFELTPLCNLNCKMCYVRLTKEEMNRRGKLRSAKEWIELGEKCVKEGMLFLLLTGGEPFSRPDFFEIFDALKAMGLIISINTNGTLLDEKTVKRLIANPPSKVNITLYGSSRETYENLCGNGDAFEKTKKAITMLVKAGILVNVSYSITPYNVDDMEGIFNFCKEVDVPINPTAYMFPPARKNEICDKVKPDRLTAELAGRARYMSEKYKFSPEQFALRKEAVKNGEMVSSSIDECDGREPDEKMGCMAGRASFWVTWDGRMTPCGMMTSPVTYPFKNDFVKEWQKLNKEVNNIYLPPACGDCEKRKLCGVCAALTTAETGESFNRPEYLCNMVDSYCKFMLDK